MTRDFATDATRRIVLDLPKTCPEAPPDTDSNLLPAPADGRTTAYVLASQAPFNRLRQTASQYAGMLLLAAIGGNEVRDLPMLAMAADAIDEASDAVLTLPVTPPAAHHHGHMVKAVMLLKAAAQADWGALKYDAAIAPGLRQVLTSAIDHLRWASLALPGFEMTSMSGCCASHPTKPAH